ncbi:MAG TPA: 4-alpha-glucanotransferase [Burkholderiales bacterium]|nr:4-alpha-glucanotransferase [Burkholderiales bacterium]
MLRSERNWGHGDFGDLARLIPLAASRGAAGIGLNPLHALFIERATEASPYAPNSRIFLNPLYIDMDAIPDFPGAAAADIDVEALRAGDLIDHALIARAKLDGLRTAFEHFLTSAQQHRRADFDAYRRELGERLHRFSCFEVLRARFAPARWQDWPEPWRNPTHKDLQGLREEERSQCEFQEYMQWIADRQLEHCKKAARRAGMPVGLYLDVAVGIHPDGADAWSAQERILSDVSVGAPPDEFNPTGQNWGLAPFNPATLPEDDFAELRALMKAAMRHAGAIRLDHVLGLQRIFMIPRGCAFADGTYVRFPFEQSLRAIAEESIKARCVVIGEDLGTVPEGFRETITRWGLWTYRVMLFERDGDGRYRPPETYPEQALATFNTHDLASLRGWMEGHDLRTKRKLGLDPGESDEARAWARQCLDTALTEQSSSAEAHQLAAVARFLAQTRSRLVAVGLDDIVGALEQINIPGTLDEHPNWRRRLPSAIEDLDQNKTLNAVAEAFARSGRSFR